MAASGAGLLVFINDITADRRIMMNLEVYSTIFSARIQLNALKLIQKVSHLTHNAKATQKFPKREKWKIL